MQTLYRSFVVECWDAATREWEAVGKWRDTREAADAEKSKLEQRPGVRLRYQVVEITTIRRRPKP